MLYSAVRDVEDQLGKPPTFLIRQGLKIVHDHGPGPYRLKKNVLSTLCQRLQRLSMTIQDGRIFILGSKLDTYYVLPE
jgi:hypothetical protein